MNIFFYPHLYLRDRHLETIRKWPEEQVINKDIADKKHGAQVSREKALDPSSGGGWKQRLPLLNIKIRPNQVPKDAIVYVWGGVIATGQFIVDLDNPWSLVGYNIKVMPLYRWVLKKILLSERCLEVRCMSKACRDSLKYLFGDDVYDKASVHYPVAGISIAADKNILDDSICKFVFIGTQFEIKGGKALLAAFKRAKQVNPLIQLDIVTHLPKQFVDDVIKIPGVTVYSADFSREEIFNRFFSTADVLLHPSYMESFGMTILEALSQGLAIIANDIYAIGEMVIDDYNGFLLEPPIAKWNGVIPNHFFMQKQEFVEAIRDMDDEAYVLSLSNAIIKLSNGRPLLKKMKNNSLNHFNNVFIQNVS